MAARRALACLATALLALALVPALALGQDAGEPVTETVTESGYCDNPDSDPQGAVWEREYAWEGQVLSVVATLVWSDDEGASSNPDAFTLSISDAKGASDDASGSSGDLEAIVEAEDLNATWTVTVELTDAGMTPLGPLGRIGRTDPGNSWRLTIEYTHAPEEGPGGGGGPPANVVEVLNSPVFKAHIVLMVSSTVGFLVVGLLAGAYLVTRGRWKEDPGRLKRLLANPRAYRSLAPHVWFAFFIAAVPIGMWVSGKYYGWQNAWTSLPVVWNKYFWDITNSDHSALLVLVLWGLPMWLNRGEILTRDPHVRWWMWSGWLKGRAERAPAPRLSDREMALVYFFLGVLVFFLFIIQPHGND